MPGYIYWDVDPEILRVGAFAIRWYGVLFATAFFVGYLLMKRFLQDAKRDPALLDSLTLYVILGTVIGARLGHVLFYDPDFYFAHPVEIFKIWKGGLASHGGAIGIVIALWLFTRKYRQVSFLWLVDRIAIPAALGGAFIRIGNLFNSEIIGKPTDLPWAFVFARVDTLPRHPSQIYEALAYAAIFLFLFSLYKRSGTTPPQGKISGWFFLLVFSARFLIEFVKEVQEPFEAALPLDMGQILSIPFIFLGIYLLVFYRAPHTQAVKGERRKVKAPSS